MKKYVLALSVLLVMIALKVLDPWPAQVARLKYFDFLERQADMVLDDSIVLANIDEAALRKHGQWPWSRDVIAEYIQDISNRGAALVVAPILFAEPDRAGKDSVLEQAFREHPVVIAQVPTTQVREPYARPRGSALIGPPIADVLPRWPGAIAPLPRLAEEAAGVGMVATMPEPDGVVRRSPMLVAVDDKFYPSITFETLRVLTGEISFQVKSNKAGVEVLRIPGQPLMYTDPNSRIWPSRAFTYQSFSVTNMPEDLDGKIVILSLTAEGFSNPVATSHGEMLPGTVIATDLSSILNQVLLVRPAEADFYELAAILLFGLIMVFLAIRIKLVLAGLLFLLPVSGLIAASWFAHSLYFMLYDAVLPVLTLLLVFGTGAFSRALEEFRLKQQIKKQFGTYLSPAMVEKLQENPDLLKLGGEERELSIMFTDVRGFTAISEHYGKDVQGLTKIMNRYMTAMTAAILRNEGTLDKYIGDAQMAFWNAPLDDKDHAKNAVKTMLQMLENLKEFNDEIAKEGVPAFGMGLGINTGTVVVGNMGSDQRFDYTCLGDTVNLASRLEGQSKPYGVSNVIGPLTYRYVREEYLCLALDTIAVKGKKEGVDIYTVLGRPESIIHVKMDLDMHANMMKSYKNRRFDDAIYYAKRLKGCFGGKMDAYYDMWMERCEELKSAGLSETWDGVYRATSK